MVREGLAKKTQRRGPVGPLWKTLHRGVVPSTLDLARTGDRARGRVVWWGWGAPERHTGEEAPGHGLTALGGGLARAGFEG